MNALYCYATERFFKIIECRFCFTSMELEHLAKGEWVKVTLVNNFDGDLSHYFLDSSKSLMSLLPENEWPENIIIEDVE